MAQLYVHPRVKGSGRINWPVRPRAGVEVPQTDAVLTAVTGRGFRARVGYNHYEIAAPDGRYVELEFGASAEDWEQAAADLEAQL